MRWIKGISLLLPVALLVAGCYHMRLYPVPIEPLRFVVSQPREKVFPLIQYLLEEDGFAVTDAAQGEGRLVTDFRLFYTETGFGQPAEGRNYLYTLRVTLRNTGEGCEVTLEPQELEMRSHYVEGIGGQIVTLTKSYPYDHYPGMFDLSSVSRELERVRALLERNLR